MTEDEAKTKWCPMKKFERHSPITFTGTPEEQDWFWSRELEARDARARDMNCIGSQCMMWRWEQQCEIESLEPLAWARSPVAGYCGLAGKC